MNCTCYSVISYYCIPGIGVAAENLIQTDFTQLCILPVKYGARKMAAGGHYHRPLGIFRKLLDDAKQLCIAAWLALKRAVSLSIFTATAISNIYKLNEAVIVQLTTDKKRTSLP